MRYDDFTCRRSGQTLDTLRVEPTGATGSVVSDIGVNLTSPARKSNADPAAAGKRRLVREERFFIKRKSGETLVRRVPPNRRISRSCALVINDWSS